MPRGRYKKTPNGKKMWTPEEERYLEEAWGNVALKTIAKKLGRSEAAVVVRIQRLGLGPGLMNNERISWNEFVKAIYGNTYSGGYLKTRLLREGFPVHSQIIRGRNGARFTMVDIEEFWQFAEGHKDLFDFSRMEPHALGLEPEWAALKRRLDTQRRHNTHAHNDPWTPADDSKLRRMVEKQVYTYPEIAEALRRSEGAVKRRLIDLEIRQRPVRASPKPWTSEEIETLIEMHRQGQGWDNIAAALNRSALCVRGKYERILNPEYSKRANRNARENRERHERTKTCSHFVKVRGCELGRETCRYCRHYAPLQEGEKQRTDYIGIREISPDSVSRYIAANDAMRGGQWYEIGGE